MVQQETSTKKSLIQLKTEQSRILEKAEEFRQLILASSFLTQERILKSDAVLDSLIYNIAVAYEDIIQKGMNVVGNI